LACTLVTPRPSPCGYDEHSASLKRRAARLLCRRLHGRCQAAASFGGGWLDPKNPRDNAIIEAELAALRAEDRRRKAAR
jgi:hypothetical protein